MLASFLPCVGYHRVICEIAKLRLARRLDGARAEVEIKLQALADEVREVHKDLRRRERELVREEVASKQRCADRLALEQRRAALDASAKYFSGEMLGGGHPKGGVAKHRSSRFNFLERVKCAAPALLAELEVNWEMFRTRFDIHMAATHGPSWGPRFREIMLQVIIAFREGDAQAFHRWVRNHYRKRLAHPVAVAPPALPAALAAPPAVPAAPAASSTALLPLALPPAPGRG